MQIPMNTPMSVSLKAGRKIYKKISKLQESDSSLKIDCFGQAASDLVKDRLSSPSPCMISRLGSTELWAILQYIDTVRDSRCFLLKATEFIQGKIGPFWWEDYLKFQMQNWSGFFPADESSLSAFGERMLKDIQNIDVLGSWLPGERRLAHLFPMANVVKLEDLEPYYHGNPWSEILRDKVVLVVHPFEASIKSQYAKRETLFGDPRILPRFQLKTLKAVQSIAGNAPDGFSSWFSALDWMCEQIQNTEFDIAIIGAGAYGLPLASFVKGIGKKSVHLGGPTQILFGIRGNRWDERPFFQKLFNENWIKPLPIEIPSNFQSVESGCYW
jgi:hypothetical protein